MIGLGDSGTDYELFLEYGSLKRTVLNDVSISEPVLGSARTANCQVKSVFYPVDFNNTQAGLQMALDRNLAQFYP